MNKYADVAIKTVKLLHSTKLLPQEAWKITALDVFPNNVSSQVKSCPRNTFLGLCEDGLVKGVIEGSYTRSIKNKVYAIRALSLLKETPSLVNNKSVLWDKVVNGANKQSNSQMDVVLALWNNQLIKKG